MKVQPKRSPEWQTERLVASIKMGDTLLFKVLYPIAEWTTDHQDPEDPDWHDPKGVKRVVNNIAYRLQDLHLRWVMHKVDRKWMKK